jgi:hypothetical protein
MGWQGALWPASLRAETRTPDVGKAAAAALPVSACAADQAARLPASWRST